VTGVARLEDVWRECAPHVLSALIRRYGDFDLAEDAAQEALFAAARQWPRDGVPDNPRGWLITVASRRLVDQWRADESRAERERRVAAHAPDDTFVAPAADVDSWVDGDDSLTLLVLCCHPALTRPSQVALTLRAVAGLTTGQIAHAFLVPEATMGQRISRAKARLRDAGARFALPSPAELPDRVAAVAHVLYLIFTEGHTATVGGALTDPSLADEAVRLTRQLYRQLPDADEVGGLLALMLLTHARRAARVAADGSLIPLADQDRTVWNRPLIDEGVRMVEQVLPTGPVGPYQRPSRPSRPFTPRRRMPTEPTGFRSSRSTACSTRSRPVLSSPSTVRSRLRSHMALSRPWRWSSRSSTIRNCAATTGCTPSTLTCLSSPAGRRRRETSTPRRPATQRASLSSATSTTRRPDFLDREPVRLSRHY
jgi:RNA polymerase sigma factor (sigma-70 family)